MSTELVVEVGVDVAREAAGRWRHPAGRGREVTAPRTNLSPTDVPPQTPRGTYSTSSGCRTRSATGDAGEVGAEDACGLVDGRSPGRINPMRRQRAGWSISGRGPQPRYLAS
ncbi:hypothetical protein GCM10010244_82630 [Streptomyces coeruleorubidus]|nr:hypothetical protein GCM10010244_82630 [Streptomyces bellus]